MEMGVEEGGRKIGGWARSKPHEMKMSQRGRELEGVGWEYGVEESEMGVREGRESGGVDRGRRIWVERTEGKR